MAKSPKPKAPPAWARATGASRVGAPLDLTDTPANAVLKLAEGDVAAARACIALIEASQRQNPGSEFGPFTPLVMLDRFKLRGRLIARLHALAGGDARRALGLLHALRLGAIEHRDLARALAGQASAEVCAALLATADAIPVGNPSTP